MANSQTVDLFEKGKKLTAKDMSLTAMMSVMIAVCSWISIPMTIPFTLQTFAVFCALGLLGGRRGFFAVLVYILLGAVGVPVFSGFTGGPGVLLDPTGGYIIGFLAMAGFYWLTEMRFGGNIVIKIISMIGGLAILYIFGTAWFMLVYSKNTGAVDLITALKWCVLPFVLWDMVKLALAVALSEAVKKRVRI